MLETIIALPNDLFYNTGIATYVWILDNAKIGNRKGKVQLIDATRMYGKMPKSLGSKRVQITNDQIDEIISVYSGFKRDVPFEKEFKETSKRDTSAEESEEPPRIASKVFPTTFFGYRKVTIDRPLPCHVVGLVRPPVNNNLLAYCKTQCCQRRGRID